MAATGSQGTPPAPQIVTICPRLSRLHPMPPEICQKRRNATESPRSPAKRQGGRDTGPQRKTAPAAVKMPKKRGRPPPASTRARAFIPRAVVFSSIKHHLKECHPLQCRALQAQSVSIKADQTSSQQTTTAQDIQAKRTAKTRERERSHPARHVQPGETGTGGGSRSAIRPPAGGQSRRKG